MKKEILDFIHMEKLSPFERERQRNLQSVSAYKTSHARAVHTKLMQKIGNGFLFDDTHEVFGAFGFTSKKEDIIRRQEFFKSLKKNDFSFLKNIKKNKQKWNAPYGIIVATANENTFISLKNMGCPSKLIISESDINSLEQYDVVQVIDSDEYSRFLEQLPNVVFADSIDDVYLERYLMMLSEWKDVIEIMRSVDGLPEELVEQINDVASMLDMLNNAKKSGINREDIESSLIKINAEISESLKKMTLSGEALIGLMSKGSLPSEISNIINQAISKSGIPSLIFNKTLPVSIDEEEAGGVLKKNEATQFTKIVSNLQKNSKKLIGIPQKLEKIERYIIFVDFISGISKYIEDKMEYPEVSDRVSITYAKNMFIPNAQPVSFWLDDNDKCSILTGANSGGKTTLLEHIIQINSLFQMGLPIEGKVIFPIFSEIYYFAKTKGSANKGAFETLLSQMASISSGANTLILADEIEAVTEPGVAGKIIAATSEYFIKRDCFLVIATHLGQEIKPVLPYKARIDGIEAKGLDEKFELIIDHNPVIGRIAHSTPELIVEKLAKSRKEEYYRYLHEYINANKN